MLWPSLCTVLNGKKAVVEPHYVSAVYTLITLLPSLFTAFCRLPFPLRAGLICEGIKCPETLCAIDCVCFACSTSQTLPKNFCALTPTWTNIPCYCRFLLRVASRSPRPGVRLQEAVHHRPRAALRHDWHADRRSVRHLRSRHGAHRCQEVPLHRSGHSVRTRRSVRWGADVMCVFACALCFLQLGRRNAAFMFS